MKIFLYEHLLKDESKIIIISSIIETILKFKKKNIVSTILLKGITKMESCNNHYQPLITTTKIIINLKNNLTLPRAKMVSNKQVFTNSKW